MNNTEQQEQDSQAIEDKIDEALSEAFSEILSHHDLDSGDIPPSYNREIENATDDLKDTVQDWIRHRVILES